MGSVDKPRAMEIRRSYGSAILAGRASSGVHRAALMLMLFVGPWTDASGNQTFPDAESYWASPIEIDGDAGDHHPLTHDLAPRACAVCHPMQYLDWRDSLHARAVSPGFLAQLDAISQGERRRCFYCHVPPAERQEEWVVRGLDAGPDLHGVDCASCHVRGRQRFGPRERSVSLHGVVAGADFFRESAFCAPCHQFGPDDTTVNGKPLENTLQEWSASRYAREGQTCQSCHMPDGSHRFAGIHDRSMTASALRVTAIRAPDGIAVELVNARAGHALPTYSVPRIRVRVSSPTRPPLDYAIQRRMDWDAEQGWRELSDTRLMPGEVLRLSYPLAERAAAEVVVWVDPDADYFERVYPAMMEMLADEVSSEAWGLLQEARRRAGESSYQLLRLACEPYVREPVPCRTQGPSFRDTPIAAGFENGPSPRGSANALRDDSG